MIDPKDSKEKSAYDSVLQLINAHGDKEELQQLQVTDENVTDKQDQVEDDLD
jgi:hypothetical protein